MENVVTLSNIKTVVERELKTKLSVRRRHKNISEARHIYCYLAKNFTTHSLAEIGKPIKRNHATVLHSVKKALDFIETDLNFQNKVCNLEVKLDQLRPNNYEKYLGKEDKLQNAVMSYFELQYPEAFVIHVPNEGKRTPFERYKFKYLGGVSGVPDILCFSPNAKYSGLAIELKAGYNKPTKNQESCLEALKKANWSAHWSNSFDETKELIDNYFKNVQ